MKLILRQSLATFDIVDVYDIVYGHIFCFLREDGRFHLWIVSLVQKQGYESTTCINTMWSSWWLKSNYIWRLNPNEQWIEFYQDLLTVELYERNLGDSHYDIWYDRFRLDFDMFHLCINIRFGSKVKQRSEDFFFEILFASTLECKLYAH